MKGVFTKILILSLTVILLSLSFAACSGETQTTVTETVTTTAGTQTGEPFTVKVHVMTPQNDPWLEYRFEPMIDFFEEAANGDAVVERHYGLDEFGWKDALQAVETGLTDWTIVWNPLLPGRFPLMDLFSLPGIAENMVVSSWVMQILFEEYPQFEEQFPDTVKHLYSMPHMRANLHTIEPIRTLDDLEGKIIACQGIENAEMMEILGASTEILVGSDAYLAAQSGVVDGIFCAWGWFVTNKLEEVTNYTTWLNLSPGTSSWLMNKNTWDKLSPHTQKMVEMGLHYTGPLYHNPHRNIFEAMIAVDLRDRDAMFTLPESDMARLKELFQPKYDKWVEEVTALGYPGQEILDRTLDLMYGAKNN